MSASCWIFMVFDNHENNEMHLNPWIKNSVHARCLLRIPGFWFTFWAFTAHLSTFQIHNTAVCGYRFVNACVYPIHAPFTESFSLRHLLERPTWRFLCQERPGSRNNEAQMEWNYKIFRHLRVSASGSQFLAKELGNRCLSSQALHQTHPLRSWCRIERTCECGSATKTLAI